MAAPANPEPARQPDWTTYQTFAEKQSNAQRIYLGTVVAPGELLAVSGLDLNPARQAAGEAIRGSLPVPFGRAIERQITASLDYLRSLRSLVEQNIALLADMVRKQDGDLIMAVTPTPEVAADKSVLVAFSVVEDQTITLTQDELNRLIDAVVQREGKSETLVRREARARADNGLNGARGKLDNEACDGIDVLALILVLMRREGLKPAVKKPDLQQWLIEHFAGTRAAEKSFGGAAGNETVLLQALGLPTLLHVPYHHTQQAASAPNCARRLVFGTGGPMMPFPSARDGNPKDPRRFSFVFQVTPEFDAGGHLIGPTFLVDDQPYRPSRADRVILRIPNPVAPSGAGWKKLRVAWKPPKGKEQTVEVERVSLKGFQESEWPYLPVFQHPPAFDPATETLNVELASVKEMRKVAPATRLALLGGIQALGKTFLSPELTRFLQDVLVQQLQALSSAGVSLHLELSGVDSGAALGVLCGLLQKAGLKHISLNREELAQITSEFGSPYFCSPRGRVPDDPMGVYFRAAELLKRLNLDTLYVHDVELDLLVRRNREKAPAEATAALRRHRQAMLLAKAAVPAALIHRAKAPQEWNLVLSTESLAALLSFAVDYSALVAGANPSTDRAGVLSRLLTEGCFHPGADGFSVAVAPAVYVNLPSAVSLSGAGDMCFAAHGATAGE